MKPEELKKDNSGKKSLTFPVTLLLISFFCAINLFFLQRMVWDFLSLLFAILGVRFIENYRQSGQRNFLYASLSLFLSAGILFYLFLQKS